MFSNNSEFINIMERADKKEVISLERYKTQCDMLSDLSLSVTGKTSVLDQLYDIIYSNFIESIDSIFHDLLDALDVSIKTTMKDIREYSEKIHIEKSLYINSKIFKISIRMKRNNLLERSMTVRNSEKLAVEYYREMEKSEITFMNAYNKSFNSIDLYNDNMKYFKNIFDTNIKNIYNSYETSMTTMSIRDSLNASANLVENINDIITPIIEREFLLLNRIYRLIYDETNSNKIHDSYLFAKDIIMNTHQFIMTIGYEPFLILKDINNLISH